MNKTKQGETGPSDGQKRWVDHLSMEDLAFVKRLLLSSGSLKAVAAGYGVSYPTVRLRLDRLIEKVKVRDDLNILSEFERVLRTLFVDGKVDTQTFQELLHAHHDEVVKAADGVDGDA